MPNHIHLIWELLSLNGKELPHASFMKKTGHDFLKDLKINHPKVLPFFQVNLDTRKYQFWKRDALPLELYTPEIIYQKLDYIHNNPVQGKWALANSPDSYKYSSSSFYETGIDNHGILSHIMERI